MRERQVFGGTKTDYIALADPAITQFSADEISIVDKAIDFVCLQHTAMSISDRTHDLIWELAEIGEQIPYEAMWASRLDGVTKEDVKWAQEVSAAHPVTE